MAVPTPPATSFIVNKGWVLLSLHENLATISYVKGLSYGQVVLAGVDVAYEPGLVLLFRLSSAIQITIDNTVYYMLYVDPKDILLFYEVSLA